MLRSLKSVFARQLNVQEICARSLQTTGKFSFAEKPKSKGEKKSSKKDKEEQEPELPPCLVTYETDHDITIIGINRPEQRNAINAAAAQQICEAFNKFENDEKSTVAVLYGIGGSFCSGFDIKELGTGGDKITTDLLMAAEGSVGPTRRLIKKPVICAINGYCVANGLELALMCDLRVMEDSAILGFFNRRYGVPVIDGGTIRLPSMIGFSRALDLILTGRQVDATEAHQIGIANRIVATGTAIGQAVQLASSIAKFPQAALNHDRNSLYENTYTPHNFNSAIQNEVMMTSQEVVTQMTENVKKFNEDKTTAVKEKSMADWEKEECQNEEEAKQQKDENKEKECENEEAKKKLLK